MPSNASLSKEGESIRTTLRLPPNLHDKLAKYCRQLEKNVAPTIRDAIREYLARRQP